VADVSHFRLLEVADDRRKIASPRHRHGDIHSRVKTACAVSSGDFGAQSAIVITDGFHLPVECLL